MGENTHQNCTRQNKNNEDPGRQQPCWGLLFCTNLTQPTGALDSKATDSLLRLFNRINEEGQTILMVTHSTKAASHANRVLFIKDGQVFHQIYRGNLTNDELYVKIQDALMLITTGGEKHE
nr:MAG: gas vesicle protein [Bacteriophage sp.]